MVAQGIKLTPEELYEEKSMAERTPENQGRSSHSPLCEVWRHNYSTWLKFHPANTFSHSRTWQRKDVQLLHPHESTSLPSHGFPSLPLALLLLQGYSWFLLPLGVGFKSK